MANIEQLLGRIDTDLIYSPFLNIYEEVLINCSKRGVDYYATNGKRSFEEQAKLYTYGRTDKTRGIVTKAPPGYSAHQYGIAIDACKDADKSKPGLQPDWDLADYQVLAEEAKKMGLDAAFYWQNFKEGPHVQLNIAKYGITFKTLIKTYEKGGIEEVWKLFDKYTWNICS